VRRIMSELSLKKVARGCLGIDGGLSVVRDVFEVPQITGTQSLRAKLEAMARECLFPEGFMWGTATASYQVEGGIENNDWHIFATSPAVRDRVKALGKLGGFEAPIDLQPAGEAIRHGNLDVLRTDLDRAKELGLNTYRFSLEWSSIEPQRSNFDNAKLDYYSRVIDEILSRGMKPIVTLNHMTLPQWVLTPPRGTIIVPVLELPSAFPDPPFNASLQGWENEATVTAFVQFTDVVVRRFRDRVDHWLTLNEPVATMMGLGYLAGIWSPGFIGDGERAKKAYFNLIKAHVRAYNKVKELDPGAQVGFAHHMLHAKVTAGGTLGPGDKEAARNQFDYFYNWHFLNAVIQGRVDTNIHRRPENQNILKGADLQTFFGFPVDAAHPWQPKLDFVGVNYYRSVYVFWDWVVNFVASFSGGRFVGDLHGHDEEPHNLLNDLGWEICPEGLYTILKALNERYGLPVLITENGLAEATDHNRAPFIVAHLEQVLRAIRDGVRVTGYIHWTLADNWEWHENYRPSARFGLFTVDRADSALPRRRSRGARGAQALSDIVADGGTGQAVKKYGTITPSGDRVIPPVVELEDTEPAECGQLRAQISSLMDMIRVLEERKRRLDPKNQLDRARIEGINDEISELDAQLSPLRQRQTAIDCWV
jgi:beta-glucosidase/6-phospho-beta-glucosidase/beta-galactosidase